MGSDFVEDDASVGVGVLILLAPGIDEGRDPALDDFSGGSGGQSILGKANLEILLIQVTAVLIIFVVLEYKYIRHQHHLLCMTGYMVLLSMIISMSGSILLI